MAKCGFCGYDIERGTGKVKIMKEGRVIPLCSMKCEKNMFKLNRTAREMPWTAEYKAAKEMRLSTAAHHNTESKAEKKKVPEDKSPEKNTVEKKAENKKEKKAIEAKNEKKAAEVKSER
jgi:ribosomal protein L24E